MDKYQERYKLHQSKKAKILEDIMKERHSTRLFSNDDINFQHLLKICEMAEEHTPSSCDRKAIDMEIITDKDDIRLLSGFLVGGAGWLHRAPAVILLKANLEAYKEKLDFMPYLDAGALLQSLYLSLTSNKFKCCFVNPNVRENHQGIFDNYFMKGFTEFCGAMAVGYE